MSTSLLNTELADFQTFQNMKVTFDRALMKKRGNLHDVIPTYPAPFHRERHHYTLMDYCFKKRHDDSKIHFDAMKKMN